MRQWGARLLLAVVFPGLGEPEIQAVVGLSDARRGDGLRKGACETPRRGEPGRALPGPRRRRTRLSLGRGKGASRGMGVRGGGVQGLRS